MGAEDWLPTLLELAGAGRATPKGIDGISPAPTLLGGQQRELRFLYRGRPAHGGQQCVRMGDWKLVRQNLIPNPKDPKQPTTELHDLVKDPFETTDVAAHGCGADQWFYAEYRKLSTWHTR